MNRAPYGLLLFCLSIDAATLPARAPATLHDPVRDKNFYLLSIFERTPEARSVLKQDPRLAQLGQSKRDSLAKASSGSCADVSCYTRALAWKDDEIATVAAALTDLYTRSDAVRRMADGPLRASGMFQRYGARSGPELLAQAWTDAARAMNNIIEVYGEGKPPRYPQVDAVSYDVKAPTFLLLMRTVVAVIEDDPSKLDLFFDPTLRFALALLEANHRDEAGRLEPLDTGENAAALRRIKSISWSKFPYTVIVVLGSGTDRVNFHLSAMGKLRLELAAKRFRDGKAPLILVTGGFVHPVQTPFAEAVEMKKSLIADFGIPAAAILIDPHARHTTTNLRNAARQIYRYGIPMDKPGLITTDQDHSRSIETDRFVERCRKELGYEPVELRGRVSRFDLAFVMKVDSLHADAMDPLDP